MKIAVVRLVFEELEVVGRGTEFEDAVYSADGTRTESRHRICPAVEGSVPIQVERTDHDVGRVAGFDGCGRCGAFAICVQSGDGIIDRRFWKWIVAEEWNGELRGDKRPGLIGGIKPVNVKG